MMVEKLACVVLFSEICSPLKFVAALLCNHTVSEEDNDNNSEERQKKRKKTEQKQGRVVTENEHN